MKVLLMLILLAPFWMFATEIDQSAILPCSENNKCIEIAYEDRASNSKKGQGLSLSSNEKQKPNTNTQMRAPKKGHPGANKYVGLALAVVVGLVVVAIIFSRRDISNE